jgi:hexosaminidase
MDAAVIPQPQKTQQLNTGEVFALRGPVAVNGRIEPVLWRHLQRQLQLFSNLSIAEQALQSIALELAPGLAPGAYVLETRQNHIDIVAGDDAGLFYGITTLGQLMAGCVALTGIRIVDEPRHAHRGIMLDVARHFFSKQVIFDLIDRAAAHKLNILHLHLTDDQGWRIEIRRYPRLVETGTGEYFSQDDVCEIVRYAADRFIDIVPEIDLPGHFRSAVSAYPELSCTKQAVGVATKGGIYDEILCVGQACSDSFVENVLDEVVALFPYHLIHLGGDEVSYRNWLNCERCRSLARRENLVSAAALQRYFTGKLTDHLKSRGKTVVLWNDAFSDDDPGSDAICQYWFDSGPKQNMRRAIDAGCRIIDSNFGCYYFDYPHGMRTIRKAYEYNSIFDEPGNALNCGGQLAGVECAVWTELISNSEQLDYMLYPRLMAFAESAWTIPSQRNYAGFLVRLHGLTDYYRAIGIHWQEAKMSITPVKALIQSVRHVTRMLSLSLIFRVIKMRRDRAVRLDR